MSENETNKVQKTSDQVRIPLDVKHNLEDEATRLQRLEGTTVSLGDAVRRLWEVYDLLRQGKTLSLSTVSQPDAVMRLGDKYLIIEAKHSQTTSEGPLLGPVTPTAGDIPYLSDNPDDKAYIISPRKRAHRQVDQIYDSKNTKVKDALSRNLNVFCLVPGVSIEQTGDAPAESGGAKRESLNLRTQRVVRESDITDRDAGKAAEEIKRSRRTDRGDGEKAG